MSGENGPPVSMDVLTNGVPNQGERHNRESETFSTLRKILVLKGVGEDGNELRSQTRKVFFRVPIQQRACHGRQKVWRESSKTHPVDDKSF